MKTIEDALKPLKNSDHVKIIMPGGVFMQGRKRKIIRDLKNSDYDFNVTGTKIQFVPIPFRQNLAPEYIVNVEWASAPMQKCRSCTEQYRWQKANEA